MDRLATLKRIHAVYSLMEEIHSAESKVAAAETVEVETAIGAEMKVEQRARMAEREAINSDDGLGRSAMQAEEEMAVRRKVQLEPVLERRRELSDAARARHLASRLWSERMKSLVDTESERAVVVEERRSQAASDDRFLARRRSVTGERAKEIKLS